MNRFAVLAGLILTMPARASEPPTDTGAFFSSRVVWPVHLTVSADEWKAIEPLRRAGATPKSPAPAGERPASVSAFSIEYPYVRADVEIAGQSLRKVGLRFKGNASYIAARGLKKPFKLDFDRWDDDGAFLGLAMLNFSNNTMDPSNVRETLSYATFRAAGVPAPRTSYARVTLTVPGQHDRTLLGLYTIVECVDKPFLKDHFGSSKGMLLKPEGIQGLPFLGEDWSTYKNRYLPKKEPVTVESRRLIELVKLINRADDVEFNKRIGDYIDVDAFLRYAAANSALTNLDSFFGIGHNYYMYLHPKTDRFVWVPWDLDHSLGGLGMFGSPEQMMDWTIRKPWLGDNKLAQRVLAIPDNEAKFRAYLKTLVEGPYRPESTSAIIDAAHDAIRPTLDEEAKVQAGGLYGFGFGRLMTKPPDVKQFIAKRVESINDQLAGKSTGQEIRGVGGMGRGIAVPLSEAIVKSADVDKDRTLVIEEVETALRNWIKEPIDAAFIAAAIEKAMPAPVAGAPVAALPTREFAAAVFKRIGGEPGKTVAVDAAIEAARTLFKEADRNSDGKLDRQELTRFFGELARR